MLRKIKNGQEGFSLVELSIVLVILGLLIAGVVAGSTLVRNAELRAVTTEFNSIRTNINAFKTTYDYLPGDMKNAHEFWAATNCSGTTDDDMDGDFNGRIEFDDALTNNESYMAWCHLRLANLASGAFDGVPTDQSAPIVGTDMPSSKTQGGGYMLGYGVHGMANANVLVLGAFAGVSVDNTLTLGRVLTPRDARNIDAKIDDGLPTSGIVRGFDGSDVVTAGDCVDTGGTDDIYNVILDPQPIGCGLAFSIN